MFKILVTDNFQFMDESEDVTLGPFESADLAIREARSIIDDFLAAELKPDSTAAALLDQWVQFGETPIIHGDDPKAPSVGFSGPSYAKQRCAELTA